MNCPKCGNNVNEGAMFCTSCGADLSQTTTQQNNGTANPYQQTQQPDYYQSQQPTYQTPQPNYGAENPTAVKALVFGIISLVCCEFPIASIILGIFAVKFGNQTLGYALQGYNKRPMGILAKVFGIIAIVVCAIASIFWIIGIIGWIATYSTVSYYGYY